ncbi:MAG: TonB-dependent receptor domain-containing protein [Caulobacterales bacterium]
MKKEKKGLWWTAGVAAIAAGVALTPQAMAQTQTPPADDENQAQSAANNDDDSIVVTGSRIRRNEFTSSAPVQIITSEQTTLEGLIDTAEILQGSSIAAGSTQINNQFTGFVTEGGPGVNTLSLRGLGATRTLLLLNGRRLNPAGTRGQVGAIDLNVIPNSVIQRTEILKDGASSIYGSDAIAGVVNLITRENLDGGLLGASVISSFEGGGEQYGIDGAWGQTFDRGSYSISFDYFRGDSLTFGDRDYLSCSQDLVRQAPGSSLGGDGGRLLDIIDPATGQSKCYNVLEGVADRLGAGGTTNATFLSNIGRFVPDSTATAGSGQFGLNLNGWRRVGLSFAQVSNRLYGTALTSSNTALAATLTPAQFSAVEAAWRESQAVVPNNDPRNARRTVISPVERMSLFLQGSYDLTSNVEVYGEALWNRRESSQDSVRQIFPTVAATNTNNPFGVTARSIPLVNSDGEQTVDTYRAVVGFAGDLPFVPGWTFDIFGQYGEAVGTYTNNIYLNDRVLATTGAGTCIQATGAANISNFNCADVPTGVAWFNPSWINDGVLPDNQRRFIETKESGETVYTQSLIQGIVTGDVFQLPAGALAAAVGFEWREEELDDTPGANARAGNLWGQTSAGRTRGTDAVREVFAELEIPVVRGVPLIEDLTVNASARRTDYDSYGENDTHRVGINWQITPEYRLRATSGTSYRAPALFELFLANQTAFGNQNIDPCIFWETSANPIIQQNCAAAGVPLNYGGVGSSPLIVTGGGAGVLEAETSEAKTLGFVWTPRFADFSIAFDYFEIEVNGQVAQFGSAAILGACYGQADYPNNPFCSLFTRNGPTQSGTYAPFNITQVNNSYVNLDQQTTRGLDVTLRYEHEFPYGTLVVNSSNTWTFEEVITFFAGRSPPNTLNGEVYQPDAVGNLSFQFERGDWTYFWDIDYQAKQSDTEAYGGDIFAWRGSPIQGYYKQYAEFTATHDFTVQYESDNWQFNAGVQNAFDESPPSISVGSVAAGGRLGNVAGFAGNRSLLTGRTGFVSVSRSF